MDATVDTLTAILADTLCEPCAGDAIAFLEGGGPKPQLCEWDRQRVRDLVHAHPLVEGLFGGAS